jgi:hypothetical protein
MGILDDAIRQHLDLKRRQGAEEDELQRLEDEAFGPPSRPGDPDFPQSEGEGGAAQSTMETGESTAVAEPAEGPPVDAPAGEPGDGGFYDHQGEEGLASVQEGAEPGPASSEPPIESLDTVEHPLEGPVEDTGDAAAVEEPTIGGDPAVGDEPLADDEVVEGELTEGEEGEDVLEETPEFLRDQPEDDELWFEQGEPKDFDF